MHQLLLGALLPLLIAMGIYAARRGRATIPWLILTPLCAAAGAVWAVVPDIPRALGMHELYRKLATQPWTNIFFWHYSIDQTEHMTVEKVTPLFTTLFALLLLSLLLAALRELSLREEGR